MTPIEGEMIATDNDLDAIEDRLDVTTPGPWRVGIEIDGCRTGRRTVVKARGVRVVTVGQIRSHHDQQAEANVDFIAHARHDVPSLVTEVRWLRMQRDEAQMRLRLARHELDGAKERERRLRELCDKAQVYTVHVCRGPSTDRPIPVVTWTLNPVEILAILGPPPPTEDRWTESDAVWAAVHAEDESEGQRGQ